MTMPTPRSEAERFAQLSPEQRAAELAGKSERWFAEREHDWNFWGRYEQQAPAGNWPLWLMMAGRGFGKTRTGAEWVRACAAADGSLRIALVAATLNEARTIMVEGESGLLNIGSPDERPSFEPSLRRLTWPSGAVATLYSAGEPESLRGPEHHLAWADEVAKWNAGEAAWDNLALTMRLGERPRIVATTTPRPVPLIRRLMRMPYAALTRGRMDDNRANLPVPWRHAMEALYGGTRIGRQELDGDLIEDIEGALWTRAMIEACRAKTAPEPVRVVIGVDPPASSGGDACGIVVAALSADGTGWVLADESVAGLSPEGWARAVSGAAARWCADRVIAEKNNGGEMVESVLRAANVSLPLTLVHASRGKTARAEPVAALYEKGRVRHAGAFPALEDELCGLISGGGYEGPGRSPDRADALVWALTELMLGKEKRELRVRRL